MTMEKQIENGRFVDFSWSPWLLAAIVFVLMLSSASASALGNSGAAQTASGAASTDSSAEVKIDNFAFTPATITVKAGTQVTWINHDDIPHTVDSTEGKFKSAALDTDDKFQFRFTESGEYPFFCRMHPKMTGKVIVQP
jgi:plastocyanin